jgi:predicted helicase
LADSSTEHGCSSKQPENSPLGTKTTKAIRQLTNTVADAIFKSYTVGVLTARDDVAYDFDRHVLEQRIQKFVEDYNGELDRYKRAQKTHKNKN